MIRSKKKSKRPQRVVHVNRDKYDVYIGREFAGYPRSMWYNPFKVGPHGTLDEVLVKYESYVRSRPFLMSCLKDLKGKTLGCWCAPKGGLTVNSRPMRCHGQILLKLLAPKSKQKKMDRTTKNKSLAEWSQQVRAVGRCAVCDKMEHLNAHHLLPKERYQEFRTELINGICLCPLCHKWDRYSAHRNPIWFVCWLRKNRRQQYEWCKEHMGFPARDF